MSAVTDEQLDEIREQAVSQFLDSRFASMWLSHALHMRLGWSHFLRCRGFDERHGDPHRNEAEALLRVMRDERDEWLRRRGPR